MNVAALASTSHQPGLFDMVASPWFWVRVGGSKPPGSYTAYCPNVNLGAASSASGQRRRILASLAEAGAAGTAEADGPVPPFVGTSRRRRYCGSRGRGGRSAARRPDHAQALQDAERPRAQLARLCLGGDLIRDLLRAAACETAQRLAERRVVHSAEHPQDAAAQVRLRLEG